MPSQQVMAPDAFIESLWAYAHTFPMREHPWFQGIAQHRFTREEVILGEVQHYLRVRENPVYFGYIAAHAAEERIPGLTEAVLENYAEELAGERSHVDIMFQFLEAGGISREEADGAEAMPGTFAAIEMILGHCQRRSALEGIAMLALVESMHGGEDGAAGLVYPELVGHYGFSKHAAETYQIHAVQDVGHGGRQVELLRRFATTAEMQRRVRHAVRVGLEAWNLEWDGHMQAITRQREYWGGVAGLPFAQPTVRLPARS